MQTKPAEIQRRRSTFSCRTNFASIAEQIKVSDAEAGATRLASPQERAVNRQKKLKIRLMSPKRKSFSLTTRPITASKPFRARSSSRSPMRFMAADSSTSPVLEAMTSVAIAIQSLSELMLLLGRRKWRALLPFRQGRSARNQTDAAGDQQHAGPSPGADCFVKKEAREKCGDHVAKRRCRQDKGEVGPGQGGQVGVKKTGKEGDAKNHPRINKGAENVRPIAQVDLADIVHAALEHHVARAVAASDGQIDQDFF